MYKVSLKMSLYFYIIWTHNLILSRLFPKFWQLWCCFLLKVVYFWQIINTDLPQISQGSNFHNNFLHLFVELWLLIFIIIMNASINSNIFSFSVSPRKVLIFDLFSNMSDTLRNDNSYGYGCWIFIIDFNNSF